MRSLSSHLQGTSLGARFARIAHVLLAMSGWRLDRLNVPWVLGGVLSFGVAAIVLAEDSARATLAYFAFSVFFYHVGNTLLLTSSLPRAAIRRFGEERAYRAYETLLALMFINQGLGLGCMTALTRGALPPLLMSPTLACLAGGVLFAVGLVVKVWSTVALGVDVYYYRDMFLDRPLSVFVSRGPYRIFQNPMYGVGQLHAYGYAILSRSTMGLVAAATCHILIYAFFFVAERPFVQRVHRASTTPAPATA